MKKFLSVFILFAALAWLMAFAFDKFISNRLKERYSLANGEYPVWNDIYSGKINSDVIIHGSSRAWVHIDPFMIAKAFNTTCYNLGIDGQNFDLQYLRHKKLLQYNKKPKLIIHSLDVFTFSKKTELYNHEQFLPFMLFDLGIRKATKNFASYSPTDFFVPAIRYSGNTELVNDAIKGNWEETNNLLKRERGYCGREMEWNNDLDAAKKNKNKTNIILDTGLVESFRKYLTECKNDGTAIILVYTPEYIDGQNFITNRSELMNIFSSFSKEFSVPFWDFSSSYLCYDKKYFYNASHMNKTGATLFSAMLIDSMKHYQPLDNIFNNRH